MDDQFKMVQREFDLWGVKLRHHPLQSGHIRIEWQASPDKPARQYTLAKTSGSYRGNLNAVAHVKRCFRQDGLVLKEKIVRPEPALKTALALPQPVEKDSDQIKLLRADVGGVIDVILEIATTVASLREELAAMKGAAQMAVLKASPMTEPVVMMPALPVPAAPKELTPKQLLREKKAINFVTYNWASTEDIAREMGVEKTVAYRKLYHLLNGEKPRAEMQRGLWRRTRNAPDPVPPGVAAKKRNGSALNGQHH